MSEEGRTLLAGYSHFLNDEYLYAMHSEDIFSNNIIEAYYRENPKFTIYGEPLNAYSLMSSIVHAKEITQEIWGYENKLLSNAEVISSIMNEVVNVGEAVADTGAFLFLDACLIVEPVYASKIQDQVLDFIVLDSSAWVAEKITGAEPYEGTNIIGTLCSVVKPLKPDVVSGIEAVFVATSEVEEMLETRARYLKENPDKLGKGEILYTAGLESVVSVVNGTAGDFVNMGLFSTKIWKNPKCRAYDAKFDSTTRSLIFYIEETFEIKDEIKKAVVPYMDSMTQTLIYSAEELLKEKIIDWSFDNLERKPGVRHF